MSPRRPPALTSGDVCRVHWIPGSDRLRAACHCGAEREFEAPVELWDWLLGHPDGHQPPSPPSPPSPLEPPMRPRPDDLIKEAP